MKIFFPQTNDTQERQLVNLRERCACIISNALSFSSNWHDQVVQECVESGFTKPDEEDMSHLFFYELNHPRSQL